MKLELAEVLAELDIAEAHDLLAHRWDESEASYPDETPYFLQPARISEMRQYLDLSDGIEPHFLEAARIARGNTALSHLSWHFNRLMFLYDDYEGSKIGQWPELQQPLGELSDVFYMLIAISVVPITQATHRRLGVPEEITRHSTGNFNGLMFAYRNRYPGKLWGVNLSVLYWLRHYVSGALYTLGRMEYMVRPFQRPVQVYRNRDTDEVLALALDGLRYRPDGFLASEEAVAAGEPGFTSRFVETPDAVTGCPISPAGFALPLEVTLPLKTWRKVLSQGDPLLDVHIPAGGNMTPENCRDTMARALEFFPRYFPERPFVGFGCGSWILNPQLADIYSPTSNMILWQRELYLHPIPTSDRSGLYFIFGRDDVDPATAPRDTSLRRALLDHLAAGGRLIGEGMFFLAEDFKHYGTQYYLSQWPLKILDSATELDITED